MNERFSKRIVSDLDAAITMYVYFLCFLNGKKLQMKKFRKELT